MDFRDVPTSAIAGTPVGLGVRVVERSSSAAAAQAGRLLSVLGAEVIMIEPPGGSSLRRIPPVLSRTTGDGATQAYLAAGKRSVVCDFGSAQGIADFHRLLATADIYIDDSPPSDQPQAPDLEPQHIAQRFPSLIIVSISPFGSAGPKASWVGREINLFHASGEGFLLPNGLTAEMFPSRPPLKVYGHFAEMVGGTMAALAALSAIWCRAEVSGQICDVSIQDAALSVAAFAIQRYGDGAIEHRRTRSFRYGGVFECRDGYAELLMLENRQWLALIEMMDRPDWARDPALDDPAVRSERGAFVNFHIQAWMRTQDVGPLVSKAQSLGVPICKYNSPREVIDSDQAKARQLFQNMTIPGVGTVSMLTSPFNFSRHGLHLAGPPPRPGEHNYILTELGDEPTRESG
jgi:crotonobetainyl-CoA:carnitine CoA-transferase CaiB-like acyl-CoA transferase